MGKLDLDFSENPKDYYFWLEQDEDCTGRKCFSITPKSWYDEEHCLIDTELAIDGFLYKNGITSICDSTFVYQNGDSQEGRKLLLSLGLIEKQMCWQIVNIVDNIKKYVII